MKVLCLHGMGSNADIFEAQTNQILQPLRDEGHEFFFLDGIVEYEPPDERLRTMYPPPYLAYYTEESQYDDAVDLVKEHIEEYGPFDGVFAFSQGCHLATGLMTALPDNYQSDSRLFGFAVFMGAAPSFKAPNDECWKRRKGLDVPILHVIGKSDRFRPQSLDIASMHDTASDGEILEYDGGHNVPTGVVITNAITRYLKHRAIEVPVAG